MITREMQIKTEMKVGCSQVTALPSMTVALGLITSTAKQETSQN
jgi:hypothetical protein